MPRVLLSRWMAVALGAIALVAAAAAVLLSIEALVKAGMPYNEEGRYFDGLVVHDQTSAFVHAALAVLCWVLATLTALAARRVGKRRRAESPSSDTNLPQT